MTIVDIAPRLAAPPDRPGPPTSHPEPDSAVYNQSPDTLQSGLDCQGPGGHDSVLGSVADLVAVDFEYFK